MTKKVVLVTGASAGIGQSCTEQLHQSGWTVIGASRRGTSSGTWQGMSMDVDDDQSVAQCINDILSEHGRIDALVTCAGWGVAGAAEHTSMSDAKAQLETNFWGTVRCVHALLPIMRRQAGGRIVMIGSIGGVIGLPYQSFYSASKFALEGYAEALAYEVGPFDVQVTLVEPGNFKTDFTQERRMVPTPLDDPYAKARDRAISKMEHDEINGADPKGVAETVERVLTTSRAPRRVSVGKFDERFGLLAKRVLPYRFFEKSARGSLGV
jgi:NAD(P)-dependent dehydrogenase (short-subunit alcohol dehydrogenase family)